MIDGAPTANDEIVIVTHHATTGPSDALEDYLRLRCRRLVVIEHGFGSATAAGTTVRVWEREYLAHRFRVPWTARLPGPVTWMKDAILSLVFVTTLSRRRRFDRYIGIDSLNATAGLLLRKLGRVQNVVFWTIDYAPDRFGSAPLNALYLALDRRCVARCDETWNLSPRMEAGRRQRGVEGPQRVVPMGAYPRDEVGPLAPHRIVHMGSLLSKQGVQVGIQALNIVRSSVPDATLLIIGDGPYRLQLEALAERLGVRDHVEFVGYVADHREVERLVAESGVALATYDPASADFTYYADPGKIKNYLAGGVPVVVTDVPWSARWLADEGAGTIVAYGASDVARGIIGLLDSDSARRAALRLGRQSAWPLIFADAFRANPQTLGSKRPGDRQ